jgi:hypothetical protein
VICLIYILKPALLVANLGSFAEGTIALDIKAEPDFISWANNIVFI